MASLLHLFGHIIIAVFLSLRVLFSLSSLSTSILLSHQRYLLPQRLSDVIDPYRLLAQVFLVQTAWPWPAEAELRAVFMVPVVWTARFVLICFALLL